MNDTPPRIVDHGDGPRGGGEPRAAHSAVALGAMMSRAVRTIAVRGWRVLVYFVLIALTVLYAPENPPQFIYTEF